MTYQYKARLKRSDHRRLEEALSQCALLYNAALEERKQAYKMSGKSVALYDQMRQFTRVRADDPDGWGSVSVTIGRGVLMRVDRAMNGFFARVRRGEKPGYPRYRSRYRYQTLELSEVSPSTLKRSADGKRAYITIKGLPRLTLRTKRPLPEGKPKSLMITRRPTGYYVSMAFAVECEPLPESDTQVGIDMGVNARMTLSDGCVMESRVHDRRRERRLRRRVSRAKRSSASRRKKVASLSRETYRNAVRNRNSCHRVTTDLPPVHAELSGDETYV